MKYKPQVGDWIRFYRSGTLMIGQVAYVRQTHTYAWEFCTDHGAVHEDSVLEVRIPDHKSISVKEGET